MSFAAILIGLALLLASILMVAEPLYRKKRRQPFARKRISDDSIRGYQQILLALRDLDFDHQLGILTEADYRQQRASLIVEAAAAYETTTPDDGDLEQLIETAVRRRRRRADNGHIRCLTCGAELEQADKYCAACGLDASSTCPQCGRPIGQSDHFCTTCGARLALELGVVE